MKEFRVRVTAIGRFYSHHIVRASTAALAKKKAKKQGMVMWFPDTDLENVKVTAEESRI